MNIDFFYIITIIKHKKFNMKISKLNIMMINIYTNERNYKIKKLFYYYA